MATNFRVYWKNAVLAQDLPTGTGAGAKAGDAVVNKGLVGVNLWGTGKGEGIPAGSTYGMIAVDGTVVLPVAITVAAVEEHGRDAQNQGESEQSGRHQRSFHAAQHSSAAMSSRCPLITMNRKLMVVP